MHSSCWCGGVSSPTWAPGGPGVLRDLRIRIDHEMSALAFSRLSDPRHWTETTAFDCWRPRARNPSAANTITAAQTNANPINCCRVNGSS